MKTVAVLFLFFASIACNAQCPSNKRQIDIVASYGFITGDEISEKIAPGDNSQSNTNIVYNSGASFLTVRYFLYNRLAIGFSWGVTKERWQYNDPYNPSFSAHSYKQNSTTGAFEVYYIYVFRKYFEVYTLAGIGASHNTREEPVFSAGQIYSTATSSHDVLKAQYTPIGVRAGGRLGAFAELGIGYKGLLNLGVSFKLGPSSWWKEEK